MWWKTLEPSWASYNGHFLFLKWSFFFYIIFINTYDCCLASEKGNLYIIKIASYCSVNNSTGSKLAVCHSTLKYWSVSVTRTLQLFFGYHLPSCGMRRTDLTEICHTTHLIVFYYLTVDKSFQVQGSQDTFFRFIPFHN